jgi:hypothetical protein
MAAAEVRARHVRSLFLSGLHRDAAGVLQRLQLLTTFPISASEFQ